MRLIDADALGIGKANPNVFEKVSYALGWNNAIKIIETAPTIDVAPIKHGHWISLTDCSNAGVYCSVCHKKVYREDYVPCNRKNKLRSNYCPNCGARMRDKEENY